MNFETMVGNVDLFVKGSANEYLPYTLCHQSSADEELPLIYDYQCAEPLLGHRIVIYPIHFNQLFYLAEVEVYTMEPESSLSYSWLEWSTWTECSQPCGAAPSSATRHRERICESSHLQFGPTNEKPTRMVDVSHCESKYPGQEYTVTENCGEGNCEEGDNSLTKNFSWFVPIWLMFFGSDNNHAHTIACNNPSPCYFQCIKPYSSVAFQKILPILLLEKYLVMQIAG